MKDRTVVAGMIVLLLLPALSSSLARAATHTVAPDGSGDFATIQAAIDAALDGDVVELTDGVFTGDGNRDLDYLGKAITIRSRSGSAGGCVIDCQGSMADPRSGVLFRTRETAAAVLAGITIRGAWNGPLGSGGGIVCDGPCSPRIVGCILEANAGSAVNCRAGCSPHFSGCVFTGNPGSCGGAFQAQHCAIEIEACDFVENSADGEGEAGAIYGCGAQAAISGCSFLRNTASRAAAVSFRDGSAVQVRDCLFADNASSSTGAALTFWISGPNVVERCTFIANTAANEGAAIWSEKISDTLVRHCTFWGNASPDGTVLAGHFRFALEHCVVAAGLQGPGVASHYGYAVLSCCDLFGNEGGDWVGTIADQYGVDGNICADPLFCDPQAGDLRLDCRSPCAPENNFDCGLLGAWGVGCGATAAEARTWGGIKTLFRDRP